MARKNKTYTDIMLMAKDYGVDANALFIACAEQYATQMAVIKAIKDEIENSDMTVTKSYQKDEQNLYANPLVNQLPKHSDSANKTLKSMLDIIQVLGHEKVATNRLSEFK